MTLDTVLTQLGLQRHHPNSLEAQLDAMRRDVRRIGRVLSQHAERSTEDWTEHLGDFGRDAARYTGHLAGLVSSQARHGAHQLQRDPLPIIAIVGTGLLLARLLRRR